jgi:hypothetical protein
MSTLLSSTTHDGDSFVCECNEWQRSACAREIFYKEHDGKRYCVLHYPGAEKKEDFKKALERKISRKDFDFQGVWFPEGISFQRFIFSASANFDSAQFSAVASFSGAWFSATADFSDAQFSAEADFGSAKFNAKADFSGAKFNAKANFSFAQFSAAASFIGVWFSATTDFDAAKFNAGANFRSAKFNATAQFIGTWFSAVASFIGAVFNGNAYFQGTRFIEKDSSPGRSVDSNNKAISTNDGDGANPNIINVSFNGARFKDGVSFEENMFIGQALVRFAAAVFDKPEHVTFHTVALRPCWFVNVDSRKLNFINVDWGLLNRRDAVRKEIKALWWQIANKPRLLAVTFRQLAVNAEENNRYEEAANFRYMAMEVKRIERGYIENLFSLGWWYWALSGYGERVLRAFVALLMIWLLFAVFYWSGNATWWQPKQANKGVAESNAGEKQPSAVVERQGTAVAQPLALPDALIYSFGVMALQKPEPLPANKRAKSLVLLETILGPLQAALLALAIRRKFMR